MGSPHPVSFTNDSLRSRRLLAPSPRRVSCHVRRPPRSYVSIRPVELTTDVERHAGDLAARHRLRGADAVHLASALAVAATDLVVAVWARRLHAGATTMQLATAPATLAP